MQELKWEKKILPCRSDRGIRDWKLQAMESADQRLIQRGPSQG